MDSPPFTNFAYVLLQLHNEFIYSINLFWYYFGIANIVMYKSVYACDGTWYQKHFFLKYNRNWFGGNPMFPVPVHKQEDSGVTSLEWVNALPSNQGTLAVSRIHPWDGSLASSLLLAFLVSSRWCLFGRYTLRCPHIFTNLQQQHVEWTKKYKLQMNNNVYLIV